MALTNTTFIDACYQRPVEYVPVWFMRQAGRSLPEYKEVRGTGDILFAIKQPDLVTEITLQPVRRHGVDAAVLYSDIMVPLDAIGFGVEIKPGVGPTVSEPFRSDDDLKRIRDLEPEEDTPYVLQAVRQLVDELSVPLLGFAGAPFTLASYAIEGGPSKNYAKTKSLMHSNPELWHQLMERLAALSLASMRSQVAAGASGIQLFDSWAGALNPEEYKKFVLPYSASIFAGLSDLDIPTIHFGVATGEILSLMAEANPDVVGVDWRVPLDDARKRVGNKAVQGNMDPAACLAPWDVVKQQADRVLAQGGGVGHIFNLGHGVLPETDPGILSQLTHYVQTRPVAGQ